MRLTQDLLRGGGGGGGQGPRRTVRTPAPGGTWPSGVRRDAPDVCLLPLFLSCRSLNEGSMWSSSAWFASPQVRGRDTLAISDSHFQIRGCRSDPARASARLCAHHLYLRFQIGEGPPSEEGVRAGWAAVSQSPCGFLRHVSTPHPGFQILCNLLLAC